MKIIKLCSNCFFQSKYNPGRGNYMPCAECKDKSEWKNIEDNKESGNVR